VVEKRLLQVDDLAVDVVESQVGEFDLTVIILIVTGTQRLPSAFELPSTAPPQLESNTNTPLFTLHGRPLQIGGIRAWELPAPLYTTPSTTVQGLRRLAVAGDTYEPGTLPERAYKRVAVETQEYGDTPIQVPRSPEIANSQVALQSPERYHKLSSIRSYTDTCTMSRYLRSPS